MVNILGPDVRGSAVRPARGPRGASDTWWKNCVGGDPLTGTALDADYFNDELAQFRTLFAKGGVNLAAYRDELLIDGIRSRKYEYAAATGGPDALTVVLDPVITAYTTGLMLKVKSPASVNTGPMTVNVDGLGAKAIVRRGGQALIAGEIPADTLMTLMYDGVSFRLMSVVSSDIIQAISIAPKPPQVNFFELITAGTQAVPSSTVTRINDFTVTASKPSDAVFSSGGIITIGPNTAGVWTVTMNYVPNQTGGAATTVQAYLFKNGVNVVNVTVSGTFCAQSGSVRVVAGDTLDMRVFQNSGGARTNRYASAAPPDSAFNLYQISS